MDIKKPTLLIDKAKCERNIDRMFAKTEKSNAQLRPHFKTHFSAEVANWYREKGVNTCTVSSVSMASYFAKNGWNDITIAFPYNPLEAQDISELAKENTINILIESEASLTHASKNIDQEIGYFIKIDAGYHRTGIDPRNEALIATLVEQSTEKLTFRGFLAHAGHTYGCRDFESVKWIFDKAVKDLTALKEKYGGILSYGDTPSCSMIDDLSAFDEIRAGNFVFYDWMQQNIGSCTVDEISVCLACPVVAKHEDRLEIVVYGGAVHLSKDMIMEKDLMGKDQKCFGKMVRLNQSGWESKVIGHVDRISQEHGIIKLSKEIFDQFHVGDLIGILPVHSCLSADLQDHYFSTDGKKIDKMSKN